jgi:protein-tyrosine phosphatase
MEKSVESFIEKRQKAFEAIRERSPIEEMYLGAEVAVENGISEVKDIEKLAIQGTKLILMELPYTKYMSWMSEEVYNMAAEHDLKVALAHIHRYRHYYNNEVLKQLIDSDCVMQINIEAFTGFRQKLIAKDIIRSGKRFIFGSDAHNKDDRKPCWDLLKKKVDPKKIKASDDIFDKYALLK